MFYISGIYDEVLTAHLEGLDSNYSHRKAKICDSRLYCSISDLETVIVCVFDSDDNSTEWYKVYDLIRLMEDYNLEVRGISLDYFSIAKKKHLDKPWYLDSIKCLTIRKSIALISKKDKTDLVKMKMLGADIDNNAVLKNIPNFLISNNTLKIPRSVLKLDTWDYCDFGSTKALETIKTVEIYDTLDLRDKLTIKSISRFMKVCANMCLVKIYADTLVVNGDLHINPSRLKELRCENILVRGNLSMTGLKTMMGSLNTEPSYMAISCNRLFHDKKVILADKDYIHVLDFKLDEYRKMKNCGRISLGE